MLGASGWMIVFSWEMERLINASLTDKPKETLIKSHRGRCGKNGPRARRLGTSIPAVGCKCQANTAPGRLSPQPEGLKPFVDFCLAVSRRARPSDCFAGYDAAPAARRCGVARSGETAAGIAQRSRLQKSANALQRPSWDLISGSLVREGAAKPNMRCPRIRWHALTSAWPITLTVFGAAQE